MTQEEMDSYYDYNNILNRMLDNISDDVDKREGSLIYNAIAPAALEFAQMYFTLKNNMNLCFADTAVGEYLDRICEQIGIERKKATKAIRGAQFYKMQTDGAGGYLPYEDMQIGTRFSIEDVIYKVIEKVDPKEQELGLTNLYKLECETAGKIGNQYFGQLIPVDYIENLKMTDLSIIIIPGVDEESDEDLRNRYYEYIQAPAFGGNISDYRSKIKEIEGVGLVYVVTASEFNSYEENVRVVITNSILAIANNELVKEVQNRVDPNVEGTGIGIAPIGHKVKVMSANKQILNVKVTLKLKDNITKDSIKTKVLEAVKNYYNDLIKSEWEDGEWTIRIRQIENRILNIDGILDISNTILLSSDGMELNGNYNDYSYRIPVVEEVIIDEIN